MKKLLMGIFGLTLLLPLGVFAETLNSIEEGNNSTDQSITVGTVEVPVYSVDISWDSTSFDWIYDKTTGTYNWKVSGVCSATIPGEAETLLSDGKKVYSDNTCSTEITLEEYDEELDYNMTDNMGYYYIQPRGGSFITIDDWSTNGRIVPSVKWTSDDKYDYVEGKFSYYDWDPVCSVLDEYDFNTAITYDIKLYINNSCSTILDDRNVEYENNKYYGLKKELVLKPLENEEIPDSARSEQQGDLWYDEEYENSLERKYNYTISLNLENTTEPTTTPKVGDTIGTVTISIRAAE